MRKNQNTNATFVALMSLVGLTTVSALVLTTTKVSADDVVDDVTITVPVSCSMSGTISSGDEHTAEIANGTYQANIGTTSIKTLCNDNAGFSIYAAGFTGEEIGGTNSNKLVGTSASSNATIDTGTATTAGNPDVSNWAMKLATDSEATYPLTLATGYNAYHAVPNEYTKVATRLSGTDTGSNATGSTLTTTYAAYISKTQAADTYSGKVKYVLVHPNTAVPSNVPVLTPTSTCTTQVPGAAYMQDINASNKATILAGMTEDAEYFLRDARDNKDYCVAKLKDGNIWMTQNLDLDISTSYNYTNQNTDIGWNGNSYDSASWTPVASTHATNDTEWGYNEDTNPDGGDDYHPESYDPGNLYWNEYIRDYDETECETAGGSWSGGECIMEDYTTSTGNSHYHLGNYYNWTAAVAMNDSNSYPVYNEQTEELKDDPDQSICPANWTLPKAGEENTSNGSVRYLVNQYGWDSTTTELDNGLLPHESPLYFSFTGFWHGYFEDVNTCGNWWSSTAGSDYSAYAYSAGYSGVDPSYYGAYRDGGQSVRCVSR